MANIKEFEDEDEAFDGLDEATEDELDNDLDAPMIPDRKPDLMFTMGDSVGRAVCGCLLEVTDGYGEYGSSGFVWLCPKHRK